MKVLVVGAGLIAREYLKILSALKVEFTVVSRSASKLQAIQDDFKCEVADGGVHKFLESTKAQFDFAINATGTEDLYPVNQELLASGKFKRVLSEKPGAFTYEEFKNLQDLGASKKTELFLAYNRRNYASVLKLKEILNIQKPTSIFFEFTEWFWRINPAEYSARTIESWLLANSTHVVDLAFFLGEGVSELNCLSYKSDKASVNNSQYVGSGIMKNGALFSYIANWESAGRWRLEVSNSDGRYLLCPLEELQFQKKGTLEYQAVVIDAEDDKNFKPGFYKQVKSLLFDEVPNLKSIKSQVDDMKLFDKIKG